jgi:integrase
MGVKIREKPKGSGAWWLFINHGRTRRAKRVGTGKEGKKAAELAAVQISARLASGDVGVLSPPPALHARQVTFAEYAERWIAESVLPHRKERTVSYYRQIIDKHLAPTFGGMVLGDIKPSDVRALIAEKLHGQRCPKHDGAKRNCDGCVAPLARNTVKNAVATLRAILYQAQPNATPAQPHPAEADRTLSK